MIYDGDGIMNDFPLVQYEVDVDGGEDIDHDDNLPLANRHHITIQQISQCIIHWSPNRHLDYILLVLMDRKGYDGKEILKVQHLIFAEHSQHFLRVCKSFKSDITHLR